MKNFNEFIEEARSTCNHTKKGKMCSMHGTDDCEESKKSKIYENHKEIENGKKKDGEGYMARTELGTITKAVDSLKKNIKKGNQQLPAWVQSKITKATDYIDTAADYLDSKEDSVDEACWNGYKQVGMKKKKKKMVPNCVPEETKIQEASKSGDDNLGDWFRKSSGTNPKTGKKVPGWVQLGGEFAGAPCAKQPGQTTKPKCGSSKMAAEMSPEEEERAAERKRREDPNPDRKGKAINVATEEYVEEDACKTKVKSRYKVWPSAYASGALVKCRKVGAANWGNSTKNEKTNIDENYLRIQTRGSTYTILINWRGKYITTQMFFQQFTRPTKVEVTREVRKVYPNAIVLAFNPSIQDPTKPLLFTGEPNGPKKY